MARVARCDVCGGPLLCAEEGDQLSAGHVGCYHCDFDVCASCAARGVNAVQTRQLRQEREAREICEQQFPVWVQGLLLAGEDVLLCLLDPAFELLRAPACVGVVDDWQWRRTGPMEWHCSCKTAGSLRLFMVPIALEVDDSELWDALEARLSERSGFKEKPKQFPGSWQPHAPGVFLDNTPPVPVPQCGLLRSRFCGCTGLDRLISSDLLEVAPGGWTERRVREADGSAWQQAGEACRDAEDTAAAATLPTLSIQETNRIREQLGLRPLDEEDSSSTPSLRQRQGAEERGEYLE
eukprot:gnl/TRDRNA2_/TRDRNA2_172697_c2_seq1.p1 gnl/TRDRNA2_/TRDRNA2_172697_c2~~gnl/TRDRNA2_/TRDRNA2_172697_c2_seq1.p1  ORF type:complete len:337 (+),score=36.56 gnl/TRDRNA2_/TRDRNA2_172697_c2_seq1:131-1012(+)